MNTEGKCRYCHEQDHYKVDCLMRKRHSSEEEGGALTSLSGSVPSVSVRANLRRRRHRGLVVLFDSSESETSTENLSSYLDT